ASGASGSWRCTTSAPNRRANCRVRTAESGESDTGATDPFDPTACDRPMLNDVAPVGPGGCPSWGASTATSWPSARSARANPCTCPCTPPGRDRLYGHTIATRTTPGRLSIGGSSRGHPVGPVTGPVGLVQVPLLRRPADQPLELAGDVLGDPGHVLAEAAGPGGV